MIDILKSILVDTQFENTKFEHPYGSYKNPHEVKVEFHRLPAPRGFDKKGPLSEKEAFAKREFPVAKGQLVSADFLDSRLYNKSFSVEDVEVHFTQGLIIDKPQNITPKDQGNSYGVSYSSQNIIYIFLRYHGVNIKIGSIYEYEHYSCEYFKPCKDPWTGITFTADKPYKMGTATKSLSGNISTKMLGILKKLKIENIDLKDTILPFEGITHRSATGKTIGEHTFEEKDVEWFVSQEINNGIYRPERRTIDRYLLAEQNWQTKAIAKNHDKKLLSKLGVHTIQLRADAHFDIKKVFDLKNIVVKAPQKIIEKYALEQYCKDKTVVDKINKEKKQREEAEQNRIHNNTFTLIQHGVVIKENVQKEVIVSYLETFIPSTTKSVKGKNKVESIESIIIEQVKPIFDDFNINKLEIGVWGTLYKYECAGTRYGFDSDREINTHIKEKTWKQIYEMYEDNLDISLTNRQIELEFGWPDRGGLLLGVKKNPNGKLSIFTENYDPE